MSYLIFDQDNHYNNFVGDLSPIRGVIDTQDIIPVFFYVQMVKIYCSDCNKLLGHRVRKTNRCLDCHLKYLHKNRKKDYWKSGKEHHRCGVKHTKESIEKIKENRKGKAMGKDNGWWKGGITTENNKQRTYFRKTMQKQIFERDNYTCQICGQVGGKLQVDHIKNWSDYPNLRFDENNCRTLCMICHYKVTFGKKMPSQLSNWGHNFQYRKVVN